MKILKRERWNISSKNLKQ